MLAALGCLAAVCVRGVAPQAAAHSLVLYKNAKYGLRFFLPGDWRGYSVVTQEWQAEQYRAESDRDVVVGRGPILVFRHPLWRRDRPHQDIPILVFTREQWNAGVQDQALFAGGVVYYVSQNERYVFAIHSRYNVDDSVEGWQEAEQIVKWNSDHAHHAYDDR